MGQNKKMKKVRIDILRTETDPVTSEVLSRFNKISFCNARFDDERGYLWKPKTGGARMFNEIPFPDGMSMIDRGRMATLAKHIWNKTNMLGYRGHGGVRPYSVAQIGKLVGLTPEQAERFLKRMQNTGIIKPVSVPFGERIEIQFYINPLYFFGNSRLSLNLYVLFHEELDKHLPEWVKEEFSKAVSTKEIKQAN